MNTRPLKLYIFYCSTSIDPEELVHGCSELEGYELKTISLPCSGKVDVLYLIKAFETGADGVVVATCRQGECLYLEGNLRARKRAETVDDLLEEIGMGRGRMAVIHLTDGGTEQLIREILDFCASIKDLPAPAQESLQEITS